MGSYTSQEIAEIAVEWRLRRRKNGELKSVLQSEYFNPKEDIFCSSFTKFNPFNFIHMNISLQPEGQPLNTHRASEQKTSHI
jgi:hypothetical protein